MQEGAYLSVAFDTLPARPVQDDTAFKALVSLGASEAQAEDQYSMQQDGATTITVREEGQKTADSPIGKD